jgi:glycosyltransferase involved in cell wall biosynthesis
MKIFLFGQRNNLGGGVHFANFVEALKRFPDFSETVIEVDATGKKINPLAKETTVNDVSIFFFPTINESLVKGLIVKWAIFESDILPEQYLEYLSRSHAIWTPSEWGSTVLANNGIPEEKIQVINEGVDPELYHPFTKPDRPRDGKFRFLMCGKNETRKGLVELLDGFQEAFSDDDSVQLFLKADYFWGTPDQITRKRQELLNSIKNRKLDNVVPIFRDFSTQQMARLYHHFDGFIFPSRAEGWGLPLIEAMSCGVPIISTCYSGHSAFLYPTKENFITLNHEIKKISCAEYLSHWPSGGNWAVVSPSEIAKKMRYLKQNAERYNEKALVASNFVRNNFSWRHAAEQCFAYLRALGYFNQDSVFD